MSEQPRVNLVRVAAWGLLLIVLVGTIAAAIFRKTELKTEVAQPAANDLPVLYDAPSFRLTERSGRAFASSELTGHVWIADFVFTRCAGPCPAMTRSMADLQKHFDDEPSVRFVSFSVDPERDTPAVLSDYAKLFGADASRWFFLTGDEREIYKLALDGFRVLARRATTQELEQPETQPILHSPYFFLVDGKGRIRGTYDGTDVERMEALRRDVRRLLKAEN